MTQTDPTPGAEPSRREALEQRVETALEHVKPKLRGWLHAGMTPVALVAGIILVVLAGTTEEKVSAAVFAGTAVLLFGTSAVYHRGTWSPRVGGFLRRFDHSNIFLIIAGTYTPFALLLPPEQARRMLIIVWSGAVLGVLFRVFWSGAPRWLYVPAYLMLGWVAVFYFGPLLAARRRRRDDLGGHRRGALQPRRDRLRHQAAEPLTALVRLPRGLPRADHPRVHGALRRRLARPDRPATA